MKKQFACSILLVATALGATRTVQAQVVGGIVSQQEAQRHGLTRAWYGQADLDRETGKVVDLTLHNGTLFVQTTRARLQAIDAETGKTLWSVTVGNEHYPCMQPAASADYVATINGSTLYVIDRKTGREAWNKQLPSSPGAGPAVSPTHVFVPMVNGTINGYRIAKPDGFHFLYKSFGRILVQPVITNDTLAWTTERGFMYLMSLEEPERLAVNFRLATNDTIESRPGYWTPYLYGVSLDGYVYAVHEESGRIHWKYSTAEPMIEAPIAVNGKVFVCVEKGGMHCLNGENGEHEWYSPGCMQFISVSPTRVYASDRLDRLMILDAKTGARLDSFPIPGVTNKLHNVQSDRIFLTTERGVIQCLHESELTEPLVYNPPPLKEKLKSKSKSKKPEIEKGSKPVDKDAEEPAAAEEENPFGAGADNAEAPAEEEKMPDEKPTEDEENPFGDPG